MEQQKTEFFYYDKKIKPNLNLKKISFNDKIISLDLCREYNINGKKKFLKYYFVVMQIQNCIRKNI